MRLLRSMATALAALTLSGAASAAVTFLGFEEGLTNRQEILGFYNGVGGPNYGIVFGSRAEAVIDSDVVGIGGGNFANEPSPSTVVFWYDGLSAILNVAAGFQDGFSFFYSSLDAAEVIVYDDVDAKGNVLARISLTAQYDDGGCQGDPTGDFCNWTPVGVGFSGTAKSIDFRATANLAGFDNMTFGSSTPCPGNGCGGGGGGGVPEPASLALVAVALLGLGIAGRRRA